MSDCKAQISDTDPSKGLRLELAMGWYGNQTVAQRHVSRQALAILESAAKVSTKQNLAPGDMSYIGPRQIIEARHHCRRTTGLLLTDIAAQLRAGKLTAVGLLAGQHEAIIIPREWWGVATLNPEMNTAEGNGVRFSGLLIFQAAPVKAPAISDEAAACDWMRANVTTYKPRQRDEVVRRCCKALGIRKPAALYGWSCLDPAIRGKSRMPN